MLEKIIIFVLAIVGFSQAFGEVYIQNDQKYIGADGEIHITGEIQNDSNKPLGQIEVSVALYSETGDVLSTIKTGAMLNTIMPGMKGPFDITLTDASSLNAQDYSAGVNYKISEPKGQVIEITHSEFKRDAFDNFIITGTVANRGEITANMIEIVATLYDREGNVVGASEVHTNPDYLRVGEQSFFLVSVPDGLDENKIVDYTLVAQSDEYTAVPEFPLGSIVLLAGSVSSYIILTRYSRKVIANLVCVANPK